jgi:cation diffusion facilitator CzcD-associated flavoprotein CzcO
MSLREIENSSWLKPDKIYDSIIFGTGFAGICMAKRLLDSNIENFIVLEKENSVGGTWRDNTYPGAACDVQSHLYSFSFEPNPNWTRMFGLQSEILEYLNHCTDKYDIREKIIFNSLVKGIYYDQNNGFYKVHSNDKIYFSRTIVSATGGLSRPVIPEIEGIKNFKGKLFHSARWDHSYDLKGKKVALIGTGASSIQILPAIADKVKELKLFQRTAPWIIPKPDREITEQEKSIFRAFPFVQKIARESIYWSLEYRVTGLVLNPSLMKTFQKNGEDYILETISDPVLRKKVTPNYTIGCKRILMSNDYYQTLQKPNVNLVTDKISEIKEHSILTQDGTEHQVDLIIPATGFETSEALSPFEVIGENGNDLNEIWAKEGAEAYLGTVVHGFPNYFILVGPNTGLGHSSMVLMIEAQAEFSLQCIKSILKNSWKSMNVTLESEFRYNLEIQKRLSTSIWAENCNSWYVHRNGKNTTLWPGFTFEFAKRTKNFDENDFEIKTLSDKIYKPNILDSVNSFVSRLF